MPSPSTALPGIARTLYLPADTDVDIMKKSTTRLATTGGLIVLGACAIALAQHDSRKRERGRGQLSSVESEPATPIQVDSISSNWAEKPSVMGDGIPGEPPGLGRSSTPFSDTGMQTGEDHAVQQTVMHDQADPPPASRRPQLPFQSDLAAEYPDTRQSTLPSLPQSPHAASKRFAGDAPLPEDQLPAEPTTAEPTMPSTGGVALESPPTLPTDQSASSYDSTAIGSIGSSESLQNPLRGTHAQISDPTTIPPATDNDSRQVAAVVQASGTLPQSNGLPSESPQESNNTPPNLPPWLRTGGSPPDSPPSDSNLQPPGVGETGLTASPRVPTALPRANPNANDYAETGPSMPQLPSGRGLSDVPENSLTNTGGDSTPNGGVPVPTASYASPPRSSSMSDIQRPPMQATELAGNAPPSVPNLPSPSPTSQTSASYSAPTGYPPTNPPNTSTSKRETNSISAGSTRTPSDSNPPTSPAGSGAYYSSSPSSVASAVFASDQPGSRYLEGLQAPQLLIQKNAPEIVRVGKPATITITIRNDGSTAAQGVKVVDRVPQGTSFLQAAPAIQPDSDGTLTWELGTLSAGEERTLTLEIIPEVEGDLGSVAAVHFVAQSSIKTTSTLPRIELQVDTPTNRVLLGDSQQINVVLTNTGTGNADSVILEADIPANMKHASGVPQLEAVLGELTAGKTVRTSLAAVATQAGPSVIRVRAVTEDGVQAEKEIPVEVVAPDIVTSIQGPRRRYLERPATYRINIQNKGSAQATNLEFTMRLPSGLRYNSANQRATYDPQQHIVTWGLEALPAGVTGQIELTVLPVEPGTQTMIFDAQGDLGIEASTQTALEVEGQVELAFSITQNNGTIEVGATSTYEVNVANVGNKPDREVQLMVEIPAGAEVMAVDAQGIQHNLDGNQLRFAAVEQLKSGQQRTYRFQLRHNQAGTKLVRAQLTSANWPVAVTKEEGTLVYNDR